MMGVAGLKAANVTGLTPQQSSKWWSVSASLRGFYDDNVSGSHFKESSPGMEFEPSVSVNLPRERTLITANYNFRLNYYSDRPDKSTDTHHLFGFRLNHRFTPRYTLNFEDSFVYSNEPEIIAGPSVPAGYGRANGNAIRNYAPIDFNARLTHLIGLGVGYRNAYVNYEQNGDASRSALLDRLEHEFHIEGEWYFSEKTVGFVGYQFGWTDYTSDDSILDPAQAPFLSLSSSVRNTRSHYAIVGASHAFSKQLSAIGRVGVEYVDYYNQNESEVSPYVDVNATYAYLPGSNVKLGVKVQHASTDLVGTDGGVTLDQLATIVYGSVTHRITPRISGSFTGQYMHSMFNRGAYDGDTEGFLNLGVGLSYRINENLSATLAYSYDILTSNADDETTVFDEAKFREFNRNRVWAGVTATF